MKRSILFFLIVIGMSCSLRGQSPNELARVLQKCLDLPELEVYYPQNPDGSFKQLNIMQHGVSFPTDIQVSKFGQPVLLKTKQETANGNSAYFLFYDFTLNSASAKISCSYYFNPADPEAVIIINLEMRKSGNDWAVIQSKIERR